MPKSPTSLSTYRLSDHARYVVAPKGVTSSGWAPVEAKCRELGISFRQWQPSVGRLILAKRADGKYAATIGGTGLSIPRQVGKTFLVGAIVFALCLLRPNLTVIWTAHRLRTAEETFRKMQAFAKRRRIAPHILKIVLGSGDEAIEFRNGSRILFGARESGFGLGFDEVDVLIFDEAQRLKAQTLDDMVPAANQSRQPCGALMLFMGTPPRPSDSGEVFTQMRTEVLTGEDDDTGWVEFGAVPDYVPAPLPDPLTVTDWKQIEIANPSFPDDTPREAILRMRKKLGADSFRREGMGIWDKIAEGPKSAVSVRAWDDLQIPDEEVPTGRPTRYALSMSPERVAVVAVAIPGEVAFVDMDPDAVSRVDDSRKLVEYLVGKCGRRITVMIDTRDPAAQFIAELRARGVKVNATTQSDSARACAGLESAIKDGRVCHIGQPAIRAGIVASRRKSVGYAGLWEFDPSVQSTEASALRAMTLALHGLSFDKPRQGRGQVSSRRTAVVM